MSKRRSARYCPSHCATKSKQQLGSSGGEAFVAMVQPADSRERDDSAAGVRFRAPGTAPLVGFAMKAGYRRRFKTTNEFMRLKGLTTDGRRCAAK